MTSDLQRAIEVMKELAPEQQDDLARLILRVSGHDPDDDVYELTPEEEADIRIGLEQADRGEFATDEELRAIWARYSA